MKKLMVAAAAALTATIGFSVESSNIVGYQNIETAQGYAMRVPTFKAITGNFKVSDIGVTGAIGAGGDSIQKVEANGQWGDVYYYLTMDGTGWLEDGWYKADQMTPVDDTDIIGVGEAFFVSAGSDMVFTYAGQVLTGKPSVPAPLGYSMIGNPTPVQIKISQIEISGAIGAGGDSIQKVESNGQWGDVYYYLTMDGTGWLEDGWYKADQMTPVEDTDILEAGDGLFLSAGSDLTITFPAAL